MAEDVVVDRGLVASDLMTAEFGNLLTCAAVVFDRSDDDGDDEPADRLAARRKDVDADRLNIVVLINNVI